MDSRERVSLVLAGEKPDRVPLDDVYWETTVERWYKEGLPAGVDARDYFGTNEIIRISGDYTMQFPERVVMTGENVREYWDADGAHRRDLHVADGWTSQWLEFTIKDMDSWQEHAQQMAFHPSRITQAARDSYAHARKEGRFVCYMGHACFHPTWMRIGMENLLMDMKLQPDYIRALFAAHAQLIIDIFEEMLKLGMTFDGALLADDLGYRAGPLISPKLYRELVFPYHKQLCDHFAERGLKTILHTDGDVSTLIPHYLDAGFAALNPLEVKSGFNLKDLYAEYGGRLVFYGNIDVRKLSGTRADIEEEIIPKMALAREHGGYIYYSDHSVPHSVSFDNYSYAIQLLREYGVYG